jgi:hypothetical protein
MAAGLGFKTFTTGDVLTAGDTNGYLMQGVWVFADAAARTAAVASPQEGNMSFLKDTNSTEYYSGAAWVAVGGASASGLTLISRSTWSAAAAVNVNNCFTSTYSNYRILIYSYANSTYDYFMRLRAGGTDNTAGNYSYQQIDAGNTTVTAARGSAQTSFKIGEIHTTYSGYAMDVYAPQESTQTNFANMGITGASSGTTLCNRVGGFYDTTSFDGFSLYPPSGNFTGVVTVYGYQKS